MFKSLLTLLRGTANSAAEATIDQNALLILDQQIRDCGAAINRARRALAVAIAQDRQEQMRLGRLEVQIGDLEERATQALNADREDLAIEAAEAIASLENERDASAKAQANFAKEHQQLVVKAVAVEGKLLAASEIDRLAKLPTREQAISLLMAVIKAPLDKFARTLAEPHAKLARTLAAVRDKKEAAT